MGRDYYVNSYFTFRVLQIAGQKEMTSIPYDENKDIQEQLATFPSAQPTSLFI